MKDRSADYTNPTDTMARAHVDLPHFRLPDADSTAEIILAKAMEFCAHKMGLSGTQDVFDRLRQGDGNACKYCHYSVAKQVAASLGMLDENVKSVYIIDYDATPEDLCFGQETKTLPIHLIVWTERKTQALDALVESLDDALVHRYAEMTSLHKLAHMLDVQVVDDADVKDRIGYGAMLSSLYQQPIQVWER